MGSNQSQESPTVAAPRNSQDQRSSHVGDLSSRKSASVPSRQNQSDPRKRIYLSVGDEQRGERDRNSSGVNSSSRHSQEERRNLDDSPLSQNLRLSQPPSHGSHHSSHSHGHHRSRGHHRQRQRPPADDSPTLGSLELSMPMFSSSRTQPTESSNDPIDADLDFVLVPRPPAPRHRRFFHDGRSEDVNLDFSMASLSQRLREAGLFTEGSTSASGSSGSGSSSSRRHRQRRHRDHSSHSSGRSRHLLSSSAPPSSVVLVRGLSARMTCPLCSKDFSAADLEEHILTCMAKPRVRYNVDTLQVDSGECSICLEDMLSGDQIARLPCLCIYHIKCLQQWYKVNQNCPEHPDFSM